MKEQFEKLSAERCTDLEFRNTMDVASIFEGETVDDPNVNNLYLTRFGRIPNRFRMDDIDCKKANKWLMQHYQDNVTDCCYTNRYEERKELYFDDIYYFLFDDLLVYLERWGRVTFLYRKTDNTLVNKLVTEIKKFKKRSHKPEIDLLVTNSHGLSTRTMKIMRPKLSVEDNYNDDFLPVHQIILDRLRKKNDIASRKTRNRQNVVYPLFDYQNQKACNFSTAQHGSLHHRSGTDECAHQQSQFGFRYRRRRKHHHRPQP